MKPNLPKIEPQSLSFLPAAVQRALVTPLTQALEQIRTFMSGNIAIENLRVARVDLVMVSGTELAVALPRFGMPLLWTPGRAILHGGTAAHRISDYGLNPNRADGMLGLTCSFDAAVTCDVTGLLWAG